MATYFLDKAGLATFWNSIKTYYSASTIDSRIGYAVMAGKLSATKNLSLSGDAKGSVTTDFSSDPSITVTIADATTDTHGFMSATDKTRFDSLATIKSINNTASVTTADGLELNSDGKLTLKIKDYVTSSAFSTYKTEVSSALALKAPLASPSFTGTIKVNSKKVLDEEEVDAAIKSYVSGAEVLRFKGVVDATTFNTLTSYTKGDTYKAKADGTYAGNICEAGDMLICVSSYGSAFANSDWSVIQTNIDGYVIGPASATDGNIPLFNGTTGKLLKNSAYSPSSFLSSSTKYAVSSSVGGAASSAVKLTTENIGSATKPVYFKNGVPVVGTYELNKTVPSNAVFTDTDTKVTAVGNHYTPTGTDTKSADASSTTSAVYGETSLVTGVNLTVDKAGHLTDISVDSIRMPAQYSHPTHTAYNSGLYKVTVDSLGHVSSATAVAKSDITNLGIPSANTWRGISVDDVSKLTDTATALNFLSGANIDITYDSTKKGVQFDVSGLGSLAFKNSLSASEVNALPDTTAYIKSISKTGDVLTITPSSGDTITFEGATYDVATTTTNGLMSSSDKSKLNGIAAGAQVNTITGVKGNAETTYRTGNVNITPANIGALPTSTAYVKSITKSGSTLTITPSSGSAITFTDTDTVYTHPSSGVTAGTYKSVTVNAQGHVTAGTNPTTLSGYGITDAKIASGTITLGSNSITPLTSHQTVVNGDNTANWGESVTVGTVGNTPLTFTMPADPSDMLCYFRKQSYAVSASAGDTAITIPNRAQYRNGVDILFIHNKGVYLKEDTDYTKSDTGITLTNALEVATTIEIDILRAVSIGSQSYDLLKGDKGDKGTSITSVEQTTTSTEDDGQNIVTVTLSDDTSSTFTVKNGSKGSKGDKGDKGATYTASELLDLIYPVGAIYTSIKATSPAATLGGTWTAIEDNRFLMSASSGIGEDGGSSTHSHAITVAGHTLTVSEIPAHTHLQYVTANPGLGTHNTRQDFDKDAENLNTYAHVQTGSTGGGGSHSHSASSASASNIPPYIKVYMWRRTA